MANPVERAALTDEQAAEAQLIRLAVGGDQLALEKLLVSRHEQLLRFLERGMPAKLQAKIAPEDLLQQTYLQVFKSIGGFEPKGPGSFFAWLKTIANRKLIDAGRSRTREQLANQPAASPSGSVAGYQSLRELVASPGAGAGTVAMADELRGAFHVALVNLPDNYREVVQLRYLEDLSLEEVAQRLEISTGAARGLCHRARQALRDEILRLSRYI